MTLCSPFLVCRKIRPGWHSFLVSSFYGGGTLVASCCRRHFRFCRPEQAKLIIVVLPLGDGVKQDLLNDAILVDMMKVIEIFFAPTERSRGPPVFPLQIL